MTEAKKPVVWVLGQAERGDYFNRLAVAKALNPDCQIIEFFDHHKIILKNAEGLSYEQSPPQWPDILICASNTAPEMPPNTKTLMIGLHMPDGTPGSTSYEMDASLAFRWHPELSDRKAYRYDTVPSRITPALLAAEAKAWQNKFSAFEQARPVYMLVLGGNNDGETAKACEQIKDAIAKTGGSVIVTSSPRTLGTQSVVREAWKDTQPFYFFDWNLDQKTGNPYVAMLALADKIIMPMDSLSMVSDAIATGKETYLYRNTPLRMQGTQPKNFAEELANAQGVKPPHIDHHTHLYQQGLVHSMDELADGKEKPQHPPSNSADAIAAGILGQLKLKNESPYYYQRRTEFDRIECDGFVIHRPRKAPTIQPEPSPTSEHAPSAELASPLTTTPTGGWVKSLFGGMLTSQKSGGMAK